MFGSIQKTFYVFRLIVMQVAYGSFITFMGLGIDFGNDMDERGPFLSRSPHHHVRNASLWFGILPFYKRTR